MKMIFLVITILLLTVNGYSQITFQKTYGGGGGSSGSSVQQTIDGGYIIGGSTDSYGAGGSDVYLIKTNEYGDTLWNKTYGGIDADVGNDAQQTNDGGYIIVGATESFGAGSSDVYFIKTDSIGDTLWSKTYGGINGDDGGSVYQTADSGYIIAGFTESYPNNREYLYLIRTNSFGDTTFTKVFSNSAVYADFGISVKQTNDGGFIITGMTGDDSFYNHVYLIKLKHDMDTAWSKTYGGARWDNGNSVQQTTDGGYIIAGQTNSFGAGGWDVYLIKTDSLGDTLFTKTYGGTGDDEAESVQQTSDGGYIIAGWTNSFGAGGYDVYLVKTDSLGDTLWTRTFGGTADDRGYSVQQTTDGGYIITGDTYSFGAGNCNIYLIKTDAEGNKASPCYTKNAATIVGSTTTQVVRPPTIVGSGAIVTTPPTIIGGGDTVTTICFTVGVEELKTSNASALIYPNPNDGSFTISYHLSSLGNELLIKDVFGRTVYSSIITSQAGTQSIDVPTLAKGIYYWEVVSDNGVHGMGKLAVIK
jgi:hypothetical protein